MNIKKLMSVALSGDQITKATGVTRVVTLSDFKRFTKLSDLLGPQRACVLLYETADNYGHWCCLFEVNENLVEFFDPYGMMIDHELKYIPDKFLKSKSLNHTYITKLLYDSKYGNIEWNNHPLQSKQNGVNTCGRHVIVRLNNRKLKLDEYIEKISKSGYDPDTYVTIVTKNIR